MNSEQRIYEAFRSTYEKDRVYIDNTIVRWRYLDINQNKDAFYDQDRLYSFAGVSEVKKWFIYATWNEKMDYFPASRTEELVEISRQLDEKVFAQLGLEFDFERQVYDNCIGKNNSSDYILQNMYAVPERYRIRHVLDFGAGFGRQANLWGQKCNDLIYVGMDAIPNSYCTQNIYYQCLGLPYYEYVDSPDNFRISDEKKGIYHLPSWRYDLLPSDFFDLIICSQVLSEIHGRFAKKMIGEFRRILKPGGALFVRDPGPYRHKFGNKVNIDRYIDRHGFSLEFRPYIIHKVDLYAFPRIWRKVDPRVEETKREKFSLSNYINYYSRGLLKRLYRKLARSA